MTESQQLDDDVPVRRFEYDDELVLAADVGIGDATVDVVGDTVIVVSGGEQYELTVPETAEDEEDARAFIKNGVLTIEVEL
jgi:HSP20 family molecular chaperone IbpA